MGKIVVLFSGQGAQYAGMGKDLYDNFEPSRQIFELADSYRPNTSKQCFNGDKQILSETINTQPCVFTVNLASYAALLSCGIKADAIAGFSLGEICGAVACGMIDFESAFKLVNIRAQAMQGCAESKQGEMAAILKIDTDTVEKLCKEIGGVYIANFNSPYQTVVAGDKCGMDLFTEKAKQFGGKVIRLAVSGAFHSPYMSEAAENFLIALNDYELKKLEIPLYSNVTSKPYSDDYKQLLSLQIKSPVRWHKTMENLIDSGFDTFIEAGTGSTLCNLASKMPADIKAFKAENLNDIKTIVSSLKGEVYAEK